MIFDFLANSGELRRPTVDDKGPSLAMIDNHVPSRGDHRRRTDVALESGPSTTAVAV